MKKYNEDGKKYRGEWQSGSVIQQKLEGPVGKGSIDYPNGDRFEGFFHLSFAHINGPAYMADGCYTFANGDRIEHCWINPNDALHGVYETLHADGSRSFAMWYCGQKKGIELVPSGDSLAAREYRDGEKVDSQKAVSYTFTPDDDACNRLEVVLSNGIRVVQWFDYNNADPALRCKVYYDSGDWIECFAHADLMCLKPWDGYFTYHRTKDGMMLDDQWKNGKPEGKKEWEHDDEGARKVTLPSPYGGDNTYDALLWPDGHIRLGYSCNYFGQVKDDRPEGHGELYDSRGRRYVGEFHNGLCHGHGVYTFPNINLRQEGEWANGVYQNPNAPKKPVMLHIKWWHEHCSPGGSTPDPAKEWTLEAKLGELNLPVHTCGATIEAIDADGIILTEHGLHPETLTPGQSTRFYDEVEGREWSDGCVYDSDEYTMEITWIQ